MVTEGSQHLPSAEGGARARGACGAANSDGFVLRKGGRGPGDVVAFMLTRARSEEEEGPAEEGANDRLLERGDDAGMDGGIHDSVFDGVKTAGEDVVVSREAHVAGHRRWCLIRLSGG